MISRRPGWTEFSFLVVYPYELALLISPQDLHAYRYATSPAMAGTAAREGVFIYVSCNEQRTYH